MSINAENHQLAIIVRRNAVNMPLSIYHTTPHQELARRQRHIEHLKIDLTQPDVAKNTLHPSFPTEIIPLADICTARPLTSADPTKWTPRVAVILRVSPSTPNTEFAMPIHQLMGDHPMVTSSTPQWHQ
jgi:hypothetical protein